MEDEANQKEKNMNDIGYDDSSLVSVQNKLAATSSRARKMSRSGDDSDAATMASFRKMFELSMMTEKLVN